MKKPLYLIFLLSLLAIQAVILDGKSEELLSHLVTVGVAVLVTKLLSGSKETASRPNRGGRPSGSRNKKPANSPPPHDPRQTMIPGTEIAHGVVVPLALCVLFLTAGCAGFKGAAIKVCDFPGNCLELILPPWNNTQTNAHSLTNNATPLPLP